jgi:hypothetical protein
VAPRQGYRNPPAELAVVWPHVSRRGPGRSTCDTQVLQRGPMGQSLPPGGSGADSFGTERAHQFAHASGAEQKRDPFRGSLLVRAHSMNPPWSRGTLHSDRVAGLFARKPSTRRAVCLQLGCKQFVRGRNSRCCGWLFGRRPRRREILASASLVRRLRAAVPSALPTSMAAVTDL